MERFGLLYLVQRLYLRAGHRRRSRTTCRSSNISRPTPDISASRSKARPGSRGSAGSTLNADALADYVHATIQSTGPAPRIPPLRMLGGLEAQSDRRHRPGRGRMGRPPEPDRRVRDADRRLYDGQRLARLPPVRPRQPEQHRPVGEQHLRRRRAPPRQLPQGLCPARRPRHQDQRPPHVLTR